MPSLPGKKKFRIKKMILKNFCPYKDLPKEMKDFKIYGLTVMNDKKWLNKSVGGR